MLVSLGTYVLAFASSDTKQFDNYEDWEKVIIASGPVVILANEYVGFINDMIVSNEPLGGVVAFLITLSAWGVAVQ
jgi:hypothetical protein